MCIHAYVKIVYYYILMQLKIRLIMSERILVKAKLHSEQIKKKKTQQLEEILPFCFKIKFYKKKKKIQF